MDIASQILSSCYTKSAAMRKVMELEEDLRNRKITQKEFDETKNKIEAIEPLHISVPVELPDEEIAKIIAKLRQEYGKEFLMEIKFDKSLIGGCALSYKGVYKDYSVKAKLNNVGVWK